MKCVYIMQRQDGAIKIGISSDPASRRLSLVSTVRQPVSHCASTYPMDEAKAIEGLAHRILVDHHDYGEWFWVSIEEAKAAVERAVGIYEGKIPDTVSGIPFNKRSRKETHWTSFLTDDEREEYEKLRLRADAIDRERRQLTVETSLIRQRAYNRRLFKERLLNSRQTV